jgi:transposase
MDRGHPRFEDKPAVHTELGAIFVSMDLSRSRWVVTSLTPGCGDKMSRHSVRGGDLTELLELLTGLQEKARVRTGRAFPLVTIQEAGMDGFWIHRALEQEGIESHVVDAASIATSRRRRNAKTDRLDGETLLRTLLAFKRGEPRVCAMVRPPTPEEEDRRRNSRERTALIGERVKLVNRIKGLLFSQGITDFAPLKRDRRRQLEDLRTGDGRPLLPHLKAAIVRALDRLELLQEQIKMVEKARDELVAADADNSGPQARAAMLMRLRGIGPDFAEVLWSEGLLRHFDNRRQLASYAGLTPTPWRSGSISREQGVSKAGNPRLRSIMVQLSWFWLLHQPGSALTRWFQERVRLGGGQRRKTAIVALARKLLVALWKFVRAGVPIEGVVMKTA